MTPMQTGGMQELHAKEEVGRRGGALSPSLSRSLSLSVARSLSLARALTFLSTHARTALQQKRPDIYLSQSHGAGLPPPAARALCYPSPVQCRGNKEKGNGCGCLPGDWGGVIVRV